MLINLNIQILITMKNLYQYQRLTGNNSHNLMNKLVIKRILKNKRKKEQKSL